jgi:hypothetical protein
MLVYSIQMSEINILIPFQYYMRGVLYKLTVFGLYEGHFFHRNLSL